MSITLYGLGQSRSFRCVWALEEAKLDYEFVPLELSSGADDGAKSAQYFELNPQGKVPTLVHDDFVLTESGAILNYIDTLSRDSLIPESAKARARYDELAFFTLTELEQPLWTTGKHRFAIPKEQRVPEVLKTARWEFDKALNALSKLCDLHAEPGPQAGYALGAEFSFADVLLAQTFNWADRFKFELPPLYLAYRDSMYAREAAVKAQQRCG